MCAFIPAAPAHAPVLPYGVCRDGVDLWFAFEVAGDEHSLWLFR
jgi:hypothetical protein